MITVDYSIVIHTTVTMDVKPHFNTDHLCDWTGGQTAVAYTNKN